MHVSPEKLVVAVEVLARQLIHCEAQGVVSEANADARSKLEC